MLGPGVAKVSSTWTYTIRIPIATPMKPVVKQVRTSTWQGLDTAEGNAPLFGE
jgi:hypothetical protein